MRANICANAARRHGHALSRTPIRAAPRRLDTGGSGTAASAPTRRSGGTRRRRRRASPRTGDRRDGGGCRRRRTRRRTAEAPRSAPPRPADRALDIARLFGSPGERLELIADLRAVLVARPPGSRASSASSSRALPPVGSASGRPSMSSSRSPSTRTSSTGPTPGGDGPARSVGPLILGRRRRPPLTAAGPGPPTPSSPRGCVPPRGCAPGWLPSLRTPSQGSVRGPEAVPDRPGR
jgi:hypothetical protein